jgi:hypothetical protein
LGATHASAQSVTFDFEDGTDQGWGNKFSDGSATFPIVNIGGSQRMEVVRNGDFQEAERNAGNDGSAFYNSMAAAAAAEAVYRISYDYYIDTANWGANAGTYMQLGTYVNSGSGYYAQDFNPPRDLEMTGADVASGLVFQGTVSETFAAKGYDIPAADTFFRLGLIINGDGSAQRAYFDNITVSRGPEPTTVGLAGLAVAALGLARRRLA